MDKANLAAAWLSFLATAVGLGSLATQSVAIRDQLDPFHETRRGNYMGVWRKIQPFSGWYTLTKPTPIGPIIVGNLDGCLGQTTLHLSRRPIYRTGKPKWTILLAVFHPYPVKIPGWHLSGTAPGKDEKPFLITIDESTTKSDSLSSAYPAQWPDLLETSPLIYHQGGACTTMSRSTLIIFLLVSQARQIYRYSDASGLRMCYGSYSGSYQIEWPIGERPIVTFIALGSYSRGMDSYPETFPRRPRKCIEMGIGIIDLTESHSKTTFSGRKVAFAGRKASGSWVLERLPNRYSAQRTTADLYNTLGGLSHEVDYLRRRRLEEHEPEPPHALCLRVPSLEKGEESLLYLAKEEMEGIAECLDRLPWSPLAWSIHRGMKDILVAYSRQTLRTYRNALADVFRKAVKEKGQTLVEWGWSPKFVAESMANQAASAILGGEECSGDACRVVSAVALLVAGKVEGDASLDVTTFWQNTMYTPMEDQEVHGSGLTPDTVIALVKLFFVQWSHEFNYGMYYDLPWELTVA
ncbi:hypothetical protein GP486_005127 [Trichoglossum hirsutum]|uniref:Uncharacterized protein n=1 Tax=Trichoglossum hirsutum TaxID=265104 RepID=A0A9P8L9P8_9PEZI|nr:hypothetical protein GP486_005127 [Trichoglossum hirsutum]